MDLEELLLGERLIEFDFDLRAPSFFSVLGVTQYLGHHAIDALLRFASSMKRGSEIVFSFAPPTDDLHGYDRQVSIAAVERVAAMGEPWISRLRACELVDRLTHLGFTRIFHLTPELAQQRYFAGRADGLRAPSWEQNISAIV